MRYFVLGLAAASLVAQDASRSFTTYTYDGNGRRVPAATAGAITSASGSARVETTTTVNGRSVPLESAEEKVISQGPEGRVVERTVRRYDQSGRPASSEKVRIEERSDAAGNSIVSTAIYDSDLNGRFALRERTTAKSTKVGDAVQTDTNVDRPNLNGALDTVERRQTVQTVHDKKQTADVTVYRRDTNGLFSQAERQTVQTVVSGDSTTTTTVNYNVNSTGQMTLAGQRVSRAQRNPDGSEVEVIDVYGTNVPGRASSSSNATPRLREQQVIERRPGPGQSLVESFSVRRAELDSDRLGVMTKISETVCTGKCVPDAPKP
jgi:YD repeat-containing protein